MTISAGVGAPACAARPIASEASAMIAAIDRSMSRDDDQQRHRQREDRLLREIERGVGEIVEIEEVRRKPRVDDEDGDQQQDKDRFPAQQNVGKSTRRAVGDFVARR